MEENKTFNKKRLLILIPVFAIIIALTGVTYAFFNFTRTGGENSLGTGRIYFNTTESRTVSLTKVFPINPEKLNTANLASTSVHIVGDTTYSGGEEYLVTLTDVHNTVNNITIPIHYIATYTATEGKTVGEESNTYFTSRGSTSNVYTLSEEGIVTEGKEILIGFLKQGSAGIDGVLTIKVWISKEDVAISDTYNGTGTGAYGTTTEWAGNRIILTTTEWNSFTGNNALSFKIKTQSNEGVWVDAYTTNITCQRVTEAAQLHREICEYTSSGHCYADGYIEGSEKGTTITYGVAKRVGDASGLQAGDAFDCDVNKDGIINKDANGNSTERFYYVSRYLDTNTTYSTGTITFDNNYATLIYYRNFVGGSPSDNGAAYYGTSSAYDNWHGPRVAVASLPVASSNPIGYEWRNDILKTDNRKILSCNESNCTALSDKTDSGNKTIDQGTMAFYAGKAARLLTVPEINAGCGTSVGSEGDLNGICNFLMENTGYSNNLKSTGLWLENPRTANAIRSFLVSGTFRYVSNNFAYLSQLGPRPAIDVPITKIAY